VAQSDVAKIIMSDTASEAFALVKDQISDFVEHANFILKVLDEVAGVHVFVKGAFINGMSFHLVKSDAKQALLPCSRELFSSRLPGEKMMEER
jgi:hypothetical protein